MTEDSFEVTNKKDETKNLIFDSQLLAALMKCPRYFNFTFNLNFRPIGGKSNALECGSIVHNVLEFYYKARKNGKSIKDSIDEGFIAGREYIKPYNENNIYITDPNHEGVKNTPPDNLNKPKRTGYNYVLDTMEQYFKYWSGREEYDIVGVEVVRGKVIYEDDEIRILYKAKFDLIEDVPMFDGELGTDHKTMSQLRDMVSLNNQFIGQNVILNTRRVQINKIGFQSSLEPHEKFIRPLMTYSLDRLVEWQNEIVPYYAKMLINYSEANYFPPNFSQCEDKYGYCNFKKVCEHDRNSRDEVLMREYEVVDKWDISDD